MTPLSLRLVGFTGIHDGLGRDEIHLDFSTMPCGLIAIVGPNGKGKSTIIDNMHPYRIMPSRTDKFTVHAFSFYDHLQPGKCGKSFEWRQPDGKTYKSELAFTTKSKKSECFLFELIGGIWVPYRSVDGTILSDGKTESYDRAVEHLLGSPELFFTSRFLAQGRKALSTYGNTDIKLLLSEMLGIEYMKMLSKRAAEVVDMLSRELVKRQECIVKMRQFQEERARLEVVVAGIPDTITKLREAKAAHERGQQQFVVQLQALEQAILDDQKNLLRIKDLRQQCSALSEKRTSSQRQHAEDMRKRLVTIQDLQTQIQGYQRQLQIKEQVQKAVQQLPHIISGITEKQKSLTEISSQYEAAAELKLRRGKLESELGACKSNGENKRTLLNNMQEQAALSTRVPCHSMSINAQCPLLESARTASVHAEGYAKDVSALRSSYSQIKLTLDQATLELKDLDQVKVVLDLAKSQLVSLQDQHLQLAQLAARAEQVELAEKSIIDANQVLRDVQAQLESSKIVASEDDRLAVSNIDRLETELSSLNCLDRSREIESVKRQIDGLKTAIANTEGSIEAEVRSQSRTQTELAHLEKQLQSEGALQNCVETLSHEIAHWRQLSIGLGNNGLIALCIDDAGPALSGLINKLLNCYGSQYTVEILTQIDMANGSLKEGFEIVVHDSESGAVKKLEYMSGGQKVWINDCLCRGIALYLGQNVANNCMTLYSDETDGALDLDRKRQFMIMKRKVLELSGCEREFFISHTPECVDFADAVIDLSKYVV